MFQKKKKRLGDSVRGQQVNCAELSCLDGCLENLSSITMIENNSFITLKSHLAYPPSSNSEKSNDSHLLFGVAMANLPESIFLNHISNSLSFIEVDGFKLYSCVEHQGHLRNLGRSERRSTCFTVHVNHSSSTFWGVSFT